MLRGHFNSFIEMHIINCVNKLDVLIMTVQTHFKTEHCCILPCSAVAKQPHMFQTKKLISVIQLLLWDICAIS